MILSEPRVERVEAFRQAIEHLRQVDVRDDVSFQELLAGGQRLLEMSDLQIADAISVSRPTVSRWMRGKNLPHIGLRKPILSWFEREFGKRMKWLLGSAVAVEGRYATASSAAVAMRVKQHG